MARNSRSLIDYVSRFKHSRDLARCNGVFNYRRSGFNRELLAEMYSCSRLKPLLRYPLSSGAIGAQRF